MPPSRSACRASSTLRRLSEFASNARNAAEMPEKASFLESCRACRGHCTSNRRNPSDAAAVVGVREDPLETAPPVPLQKLLTEPEKRRAVDEWAAARASN